MTPKQEGSDEPRAVTPAATSPEPEATFEDALARLEVVVRALESDDLPLEKTLARFEEGQRLLQTCTRLLEQAELKVKELLRHADGGFTEEPWRGEEGAMLRRELPAGAWSEFLHAESSGIERALDDVLPSATETPRRLHRALRYSVFPGGKRIRPTLVVLGYRMAGGRGAAGHRIGAAIELIHTFSLIHDDLPCMDDDDFRRGRLSSHRKFGEAIAVLAGDALQVLAFEVLAGLALPLDRKFAILGEVTHAVGTRGVIGGQVDDLESEGRRIPESRLALMHARKTGALLRASLVSGAIAAGSSTLQREALGRFGAEFGLLFQIVDDVLNEVGSFGTLGRRRGGDRQHGKATYLAVLGERLTHERLRNQVRVARAAVPVSKRFSPVFSDLIDAVVGRLPRSWSEPALALDTGDPR